MARFVLVHGAHGGAWCWEPVVGPLAAAGHAVEAFDLPGSGEDRTAAASVTLAAYVERTCAVLTGRQARCSADDPLAHAFSTVTVGMPP